MGFFDSLGQLSQPDPTFSNMSRSMGYSPNGNSALGRFNQDQGFDSKRGEVMSANDVAQSIAKAVAAYYSGGAALKGMSVGQGAFGKSANANVMNDYGRLYQNEGQFGQNAFNQGASNPQFAHMADAMKRYIPPHYGAFGQDYFNKAMSFVPAKKQKPAFSMGGQDRSLMNDSAMGGDPNGNSTPIY